MSTVTQRYIHTAPVTLHVQQYRYVDTVCGLLPCRSQTVIPAALVAGSCDPGDRALPGGHYRGGVPAPVMLPVAGGNVGLPSYGTRIVPAHDKKPLLNTSTDHSCSCGETTTRPAVMFSHHCSLLRFCGGWAVGTSSYPRFSLSAILPVAAVAAPVQPKGFGDGGPGGEGVYLGPVDRRQHAGDPGGGVVGAGVQSQGDVSGGR